MDDGLEDTRLAFLVDDLCDQLGRGLDPDVATLSRVHQTAPHDVRCMLVILRRLQYPQPSRSGGSVSDQLDIREFDARG